MLLPCKFKLIFSSEASNCVLDFFNDEADMRRIVPFFLLAFLLLGVLYSFIKLPSNSEPEIHAPYEKPKVLSTIRPIQALVLAIGGDLVESEQLIPDTASPHSYSFRPSDIRRIKRADVIFRIDANFEALLNKTFKSVPKNTPLISLADNSEIQLLDLKGKHNHTTRFSNNDPHQNHLKANHNDHGKGHRNKDLHIWVSPHNMLIMAKAIATTLSQIDPINSDKYQNSLTQFTTKLNTATQQIEAELASIKMQPYVVFHNSWQYFLQQFKLQKPTILGFHEELSAGIKSIKATRKEIVSKNIHCVFSDASVKAVRVDVLIEDLNVKTESIDILGLSLPLDVNTSINLIKDMGQKIKHCLTLTPR